MNMSDRKLVVLGIPWEVETECLKDYMIKFGELEDCIVMKERTTGRSRKIGYVTFATVDDAKAALSSEHFLGNRLLEVKIATPKEEMRQPSKKGTRIFVARIPPSVTEEAFRSYFKKYGEITDSCLPKRIRGGRLRSLRRKKYEPSIKAHRGIGFITFANADSVDDLMAETHELGGSTIVVDRPTPKEDDFRPTSRMSPPQARGGGGGGGNGAYISAATRYAALDAPTLNDAPSSMYGRDAARGMGKKIFVGRLPQEASVENLRLYFGRFGHILDVYVPEDPKRSGHRGFGFVTFAEDGVADRVSQRPHEICGQQVAIYSATPIDDAGPSSSQFVMDHAEPYGGYGGPVPTPYGRMYGTVDFKDDPKRSGQRGAGFVTFAEDGVADRVSRRPHEICGQQVAIASATPIDDAGPSSHFVMNHAEPYGGYGGPVPTPYGRMYGTLDFNGDPKRSGHRGLGLVTFAEDGVADRVPRRPLEICGHQVAIDSTTPIDYAGPSSSHFVKDHAEHYGGYGGPVPTPYGRMYGKVDFNDDPKRSGHRGSGFVTFAEDGVAERVSRRPHEICGQQVAIASATPIDDAGPSSHFVMNHAEPYGGYGGPVPTPYGRMYGTVDFNGWGYGMGGGRPSQTDFRYRPY